MKQTASQHPFSKLPGALCHKCPLKHERVIAPQVPSKPRLAVVMESPGKYEMEAGEPIAGMTAVQLWRALDVDKSDILKTSAIACGTLGHTKKEITIARKCCLPRLSDELSDVPMIVACGGLALQSAGLLGRKPNIFDWRGTILKMPPDAKRGVDIGRYVIGSLHPYFAYSAPLWRPVWDTDYARINDVMRNGWIAPEDRKGHSRIPDPATLPALKRSINKLGQSISLDIETVGVKPLRAMMTCVGMSDGIRTLVVPWSTSNNGQKPWFNGVTQQAAKLIQAGLRKRTPVTHNGPAFDHIALHQHGIDVADFKTDDGSTWEDTLIAHHAFAGHMPRRLGHVVSMYLAVPAWKQEHGAKAAKGKGAAKDLSKTAAAKASAADFEEVKAYNARDCLYTKVAWDRMQDDLADDIAVYQQDKRSAILCREMQLNGFAFDPAAARASRGVFIDEERKLRRQMYRLLGRRINPKAPSQLAKLFFEEFRAPILKTNEKTGKPSLDINVMRAYAAAQNPVISRMANLVITFRKAQKMRSTYIDGIEVESDGRVHPQWLSYGAISGRYSCQRPSLMNLAKGEILGESIRSHYIAEGSASAVVPWDKKDKLEVRLAKLRRSKLNKVLCSFDFAQLEMRIAAYVTGDQTMIDACESSDLHAANAAVLFNGFDKLDPESAEYKKLRGLAKQSGFAICYGAGVDTVYARLLSTGIEINRQQVEAMLARLKEAFWQYYAWQQRNLELTIRRGYVESPIMGRKRWLGHAPKATENNNFPIQSGAADLMNLTLWEIYTRLPAGAKLVAQVHDQAIFECDRRAAKSVIDLCKEVAQQERTINGRRVSFPIDPTIGVRWSQL